MRRRFDQHGSATLLVAAMVGLLLFTGAALTVVVGLVAAHRVAQTAADLAALAGAHEVGEGHDGCAAAARVAAANHARLTDCSLVGREVLVGVEARGPRWLGQVADLAARSRAGPAP